MHLAPHWRWIVCMVQGRPRQSTAATGRFAAGVVGLAVLLTFGGALLLTPPEETVAAGERRGPERVQHQDPIASERGYGRAAPDGATLEQVAYALGMTAPELARALALPEGVGVRTPWRRLEHRYGVDAAAVRCAVAAPSREAAM